MHLLPILTYGHPLLRRKCDSIDRYFPNLDGLIQDMWDTMKNANGCGLAAPQIGQKIKLFIVDSKITFENKDESDRRNCFDKDDEGITETFINARIIDRSTTCWDEGEGCLSIPGVTQMVGRSWAITIEYFDAQFQKQIRIFSGSTARIIQHEYDHTEGILFTDYLPSLVRKLLGSKLRKISKGQTKAGYPMKFV